MGLFSAGYKDIHQIDSVAVNKSYEVPNSLLSAVYGYALGNSTDLNRSLVKRSLNGMYTKLQLFSKKLNKDNSKEQQAFGKPSISTFTQRFTNAYLKVFLAKYNIEPKEIYSQRLGLFNPFRVCFNELQDTYQYSLSYDAPYGWDGTLKAEATVVVNNAMYNYISIKMVNNEAYLFYCDGFREEHGTNGTITYVPQNISRIKLETSFNPDATYFYIQYSEEYIDKYGDSQEKLRYYCYELGSGIDEEFEKKLDVDKQVGLPSLPIRENKQAIQNVDNTRYKLSKSLMLRCGIPWDQIIQNVSGDLSILKNPTDEDRKYAEDMGHVEDIYMTFAVRVDTNDNRVQKYLFHLFKHIYDTNKDDTDLEGGTKADSIIYSHQGVKQEVTWTNITYREVKGNIGKTKQYFSKSGSSTYQAKSTDYHTNTSGGVIVYTVPTLELYHQLTNTTYAVVTVFNPRMYDSQCSYNLPKFNAMKHYTREDIANIKEELDNDDDEEKDDGTEFLIPLFPFILNKYVNSFERTELCQIGMHYLYHTHRKIKKKWYQSNFFTALRIIIYIIIIIIASIYGGPTGLFTAFKITMCIETLLQILIYIAVKIIIKIVCKVFDVDPKVEASINAIVDTVFTVMGNNPVKGALFGMVKSIVNCALNGQKLDGVSLADNVLGGMAMGSVSSLSSASSVANQTAIQMSSTAGAQALQGAISYTNSVAQGLYWTAMACTVAMLATDTNLYQAINDKNYLAIGMITASYVQPLTSTQVALNNLQPTNIDTASTVGNSAMNAHSSYVAKDLEQKNEELSELFKDLQAMRRKTEELFKDTYQYRNINADLNKEVMKSVMNNDFQLIQPLRV